MTQPKPENAEVDLRSRNLLGVLEALRGCIFFVKRLRATHVPRGNCTCNGLTLPKWFVEDNMKNLYRPVVLVTNKAWFLRLAVVHLQRVFPDVVFSGGWRAFAVSSNLTEGDYLVFKLSAASHFDVYIFNANGIPKTEAPMKRSEISELPKVKEMTPLEFRDKHFSVKERKKGFQCRVLPKEEIRELPDKQEENAKRRYHSSREKHELHPSFVKRLTPGNFGLFKRGAHLEIPAKFARTHGRRLETVVKLQGIYKESPVCTVTCIWETATRLYLKDGWKKFGDENMLEVEQELEFTLTSDSFFVVRERELANF